MRFPWLKFAVLIGIWYELSMALGINGGAALYIALLVVFVLGALAGQGDCRSAVRIVRRPPEHHRARNAAVGFRQRHSRLRRNSAEMRSRGTRKRRFTTKVFLTQRSRGLRGGRRV